MLPVGLATVVAPPAVAATTATDFTMPAGGVARIALTPEGSAYNSNANANTVSRVTDGGVVTEVVASVGGMPMGIVAAADGTVYTAQFLGKTIARIAPDGQVTPAWASLPYNAYALAIDPAGNLYTGNPGGANVTKVAPDGTVTGAWGPVGAQPVLLAADPLGGVVTANSNGSLTRLDANGAATVLRGATGSTPVGVAAGPDGTAYVVDPDGTITRITHAGVVTPAWATVPRAPGGIAVDGDGDVYVSLASPGAIAKVSPDGTVDAAWALLTPSLQPGWVAVNAAGSRLWTAGLNTTGITRVVETLPPSAVGALAVTGQHEALALSFDAPTSDGGSAVTGYEASTDGGTTWVAVSPATAGGRLTAVLSATSAGSALVNGTSYDVVVRALNAAGTGAVSTTEAATPRTVPGAVGALAVTGRDAALELVFDAPASTGGSAVTGYQVSTDGGATWASLATAVAGGRLTATVATASGGGALVNGTSYAVVVRALNAAGVGADSGAAAAPVAPAAPAAPAAPPAPPVTAPGPPAEVTVTSGDGQATVSWTPPVHDGGSPISGYTVVAAPERAGGGAAIAPAALRGNRVAATGLGGERLALAADTVVIGEERSCTTTGTSCTVTGLTNGVSYRFTVTATNSAGTSLATAILAAVVPTAPAGAPAGLPATTPAPTTVTPPAGAAGTTAPRPATASPAGGLAYTGFPVLVALLVASLLLAAGGLALAAGRRRSASPVRD